MSHSTVSWCLAGLPDDEGIANVGGRTGAADGPDVFRAFFNKINGKWPVRNHMTDAGNPDFAGLDLQQKHEKAVAFIREHHAAHDFSLLVGGGHDYAYVHLQALNACYPGQRLGCINIDPHLDMRQPEPVFTSGSPFYAALDSGLLPGKRLVEYGIQLHCNAAPLWAFAEKHNTVVVEMEAIQAKGLDKTFAQCLQKLDARCDRIMVSLDLDAFLACHAPGVSAPAVNGFTPQEGFRMMKMVARSPKVRSLGIYELNPRLDIDDRTARLAAVCGWYFATHKCGFSA